MWSQDSFLARPKDVITFAWSAPMRDLAGKIGISDVGLRKILVGQGIQLPPQGHWNRVHAGKEVGQPPEPEPRRPGENGRIRLDGRFRAHVAEAGPIPESGPFASAATPESLGELRAQELKAIGRVTVARNLDNAHPALARLLKSEAQLRACGAGSRWSWERPQWDAPLAQRQLRMVDALFRALGSRGHEPWTRYSNRVLELHVTIGERHFQLGFGDQSGGRRGETAPDEHLPASTRLRLSVDFKPRSGLVTRWEDGDTRLEQRIGDIAADLIVIGEAAFRQGLVESRKWEEQHRKWAEEHRRAGLKRLQEKRLADLAKSGALLRRAAEIRTLVAEVGDAVARGDVVVTAAQLTRWKTWALAEADQLDPVLSEQVLSHLVVPDLDGDADDRAEPKFT